MFLCPGVSITIQPFEKKYATDVCTDMLLKGSRGPDSST